MAKKETNKIKCRVCSSEKVATRDFYSSKSELYNSIGRIDICKDCMQTKYDKLLTLYDGDSVNSFRHLLMNLDVFYDEELYMECMKSDNFIGEYFRQVNGTKVRREKTSMDNLLSGEISDDTSCVNNKSISMNLITEWGRNRSPEDYIILEKRYDELVKQFPSKTPEERYIVKDICKLELDIEECRMLGKTDKIASLENIKSKKMKDLDIIPSERKNSMKDEDIKKFAMRLKIYEKEHPVPDPLDEFKDVNNLKSYWDNNLVKPMAKAHGLAVGEYSLDKGMEDVEYTDEYKEIMEKIDGE